ncbi:MAG: DUF4856 domain-containing protein [Taibaiella sp.]|jgi:hypothetical protein
MKKHIILSAAALSILFASCKKDDVNPEENLKVPYSTLTTSTNYFTTFKDAAGGSTVNFDGQTTRTKMFKELDTYIKTGTTTTLNAVTMKNMFKHENSPFTDAALNSATDKTIISKTAQSFSAVDADVERQRFLGYFDQLAEVSAHNGTTATQGTAGIIMNGTSKYLVNEKGFEYAQFVQKGLMGAMMLDQISNIYLGTEKMASDNTTILTGKNYTALEHSWDEAYGYLTSNETFPKLDPNDNTKFLESFLGGYIRQVGYNNGVPQSIFLAFLTGRAAIVNKDMAKRNEQINFIKSQMETSIATVAISYLNKTKTASTDGAKFHALSEGVGFIYSLRFAANAKVNKAKSEELLNILLGKPNGFWDLTNADLDNVREQLAQLTGVSKDALVDH